MMKTAYVHMVSLSTLDDELSFKRNKCEKLKKNKLRF